MQRLAVPTSSLLGLIALAVGLFLPLFAWQGYGFLDFWSSISLAALLLAVVAIRVNPELAGGLLVDVQRRWVWALKWGLLSAAALYGVFALGNVLSRWLLPEVAAGIREVYLYGLGVHPWRIFLLLVFVIGPAEEIFWRGCLQGELVRRWGATYGLLAASLLYALVHVGSLNVMLLLAALVCGLFWGLLLLWKKSLLLNCISHSVWDVLVFLALPFAQI